MTDDERWRISCSRTSTWWGYPPELLARARETFKQEVAGSTYRSLLPANQKPPLGLNVDEMAKYRERMKPHYLKAEIHFR